MAQPQTYPQDDVIAFMEGFDRRWNEGRIRSGGDYTVACLEEANERFPGLAVEAFQKAATFVAVWRELWGGLEADAQDEAEEFVEAALAMCAAHGVKGDISLEKGLAAIAAKGDPEAAALLARFEAAAASPEVRLRTALIEAAARQHPAWEVSEGGLYSIKGWMPGPHTAEALIAWFKRERAAEASAITDRIMGGRA